MRNVDQRVFEIAERQHQLVTREQFLTLGNASQLKRRTATGYLERVHGSIYRVRGVAPTWRQRVLAACLAGGRPGAASHRAAAQLELLPGGEEIVEITSPRHRRVQHDGVIAHESRFLTKADLVVIDGIPLTKTRRTLCDLASLVELGQVSARTLDLALLEAVRRNLVDLASVWREHERLGGTTVRLGGDVMFEALQRFIPPQRRTETRWETEVLQILRENGIPEPVPQYWITLPNGDHVRLDFAWPRPRAALEWDPYKYHGDREVYEKMQARTRLMRAMDWERICVTDDDFNAGMPESLAALRRSLGRLSGVVFRT